LKVNLSGVEKKDFTPVPTAKYLLRVTDGEVREAGENAKHPGSEYVNWELTIQEGEFEGRRFWTNTSFVPDALFRVVQLLEGADCYTDDIDTETIVAHVLENGKPFVATVKFVPEKGDWDAKNDLGKIHPAGTPTSGVAASSNLLP
jgi:hypothetical protein